jgi:asparagine synthase (glutamine-hydrolysing)
MSAITGIFYRNGRNGEPKLIQKMNESLSHRGPDGSDVWCDGSIALGHLMLQTTPESLHEKLPHHDSTSGLVITADARIDNRKELSVELDIEDKEYISDSYFILKAYEKWGENCPEYLLGDFAFAIWDENEEKLFCARDHMGVKPFYYYLDDDLFVFATEIRALFCVPGVPCKLNEKMVAFFLMSINDNKSTFYENIFSFNPAHSISINSKKGKKRKYWELNEKSEIIMDSEEEYAQKFRELFREAVNCRLRSAYPVGFQLSGGLDSSSVLCMAKEIFKGKKRNSKKIQSFSLIFNDIPCDERFYIKKVTDTGAINPNFVLGDEINPLENVEKVLRHHEQPIYTPNIALIWNLCKKMQEKNIRIVLGGEGGDPVVSHGQYYLRDLAVTWKWKTLFQELYKYSKNDNEKSFYGLFKNNIVFPMIPEYIKKPIRPAYNNTSEISILNKEFGQKIKAEKYLKDMYRTNNDNNTAKKNHYHKITEKLLSPMQLVDKINSAFSLESRHPFYDKRLIEFCYAIPTNIKFRSGWSRYILRIAMTGILPKENQWRTDKTRLNYYYERNLLLYEKELLDETINSENRIVENYVDINTVKNLYQLYLEGKTNSTYKLWLILMVYLWGSKNQIFLSDK